MRQFLPLAIAGTLLASCQTTAPVSSADVVETHEAMISWINPAALVIWDITDDARSETEGLDPALMDDATWSKVQGAAQAVEAGSRRMAEAHTLRVGAHTAEERGFANKAEIQARIDQDPRWFKELSDKMASQARELGAAASAKDFRRTRDLAQRLSEACQSCHTRYWAKPAA